MKSIKLVFTLLIVLPFSCNTNFKPVTAKENEYNLTTIEELKNPIYRQKIEAFYNGGNEGTFFGRDSVKIYFKTFKQNNNDKAILISTGRTEAAIKYKELIYDLYQNGYSVFIHDHRG